MPEDNDLNKYLNFAKQVALQAGEIMQQHFKIGVATENKADNTPVTIADTAINQMVIDAVRKEFPDHAVLGEEQSYQNVDARYIWVCDPIDGTPMYAAGLPVNVFALALVDRKDGLPKVAVAYDPYLDRLYSACKNSGATVNGEPIKVSTIQKLAESTVSTTSDRSDVIDAHLLKPKIIQESRRTRAMGSVLYEAMIVATGHFEAQVFIGSGAHDAAAAKLIVEEAGGKVTNVFGQEQRYDQAIQGAVISNGLVHNELTALAADCRL